MSEIPEDTIEPPNDEIKGNSTFKEYELTRALFYVNSTYPVTRATWPMDEKEKSNDSNL